MYNLIPLKKKSINAQKSLEGNVSTQQCFSLDGGIVDDFLTIIFFLFANMVMICNIKKHQQFLKSLLK